MPQSFYALITPITPGVPAHPIAPGGPPPEVWPGPGVPTHPIVIPPGSIAPGVPAHPIYIPISPEHPIVIPPGWLGGGKPEHPIVLPPPLPEHPIVIPPDAVAPGVPAHPIVIPPPPLGIWGGSNEPFPTPPIFLPEGERPKLVEWTIGWSEQTGWVVVGLPQVPVPTPSGTPSGVRR
jgi:hypothetical protein